MELLELRARRVLLDVDDAAAFLGPDLAHRVQHAPVVAAVGAGLHEHIALDAELPRVLQVVLERRARRRVAQVRGVRIALLGTEDVEMRVAGAHSTWIPASLTSFTNSSACARMYWVNSSGEALAASSMPRSPKRLRSSGSARPLATAECSTETISRGVAAGATMPFHVTSSNSVKPSSCRLGTSGRTAERALEVTASARSLPLLT